MFCRLGSENDEDTHLWPTSFCVCCWSPVWQAECRWQVVPALWWLSSRASGSETQNQSFWPLSLKRPHLETGPCKPALLVTQVKMITMNGWWMTSRWCRCATSPLLPLTLTLLLAHDSVTEREQAEKLMSVPVPYFHWLQQGVVIETEVRICQGVEGSEVQSLKINTGSGTITGSTCGTYMYVRGCMWMCLLCLDYWPLAEVPAGLWLHLTDTNRWMRLCYIIVF